jgi:hypothetical protein
MQEVIHKGYLYYNSKNVWVIDQCECPDDKSYLCVQHLESRDKKCYCNHEIQLQCGGCKKWDPKRIEEEEKEKEEREKLRLFRSRCKHEFIIKLNYEPCKKCGILYGDTIVCKYTGNECTWGGDQKGEYYCRYCNRKL